MCKECKATNHTGLTKSGLCEVCKANQHNEIEVTHIGKITKPKDITLEMMPFLSTASRELIRNIIATDKPVGLEIAYIVKVIEKEQTLHSHYDLFASMISHYVKEGLIERGVLGNPCSIQTQDGRTVLMLFAATRYNLPYLMELTSSLNVKFVKEGEFWQTEEKGL